MTHLKSDRVIAILQARMSSSRLPGKVLYSLEGKPMFIRQIERLARCSELDGIIVATSIKPEDQSIVDACKQERIPCFRGDLEDVLDRFYQTALVSGAPKNIVRLTADCPLADPDVIDQCVQQHLQSQADYTSNTVERFYPKGLDVEVLTFETLKKAWECSDDPYHREHVTAFIYQNPDDFHIETLKGNSGREDWRWTVDTPKDMEMVQAVYNALYKDKPDFNSEDIAAYLLKNPNIANLNGALG